jgi:hypothetical protein
MTGAAVLAALAGLVGLIGAARWGSRRLAEPIAHRPLDPNRLLRLLQAVLLRYAEGSHLLVMVSAGDPRRLRFHHGAAADGEPAVEMHYPLEEWSRGHHQRVIGLGRRLGVKCDWLHTGRTSAETFLVFRLEQDLALGQRLASEIVREVWGLDPGRDCTGIFGDPHPAGREVPGGARPWMVRA